jgi:Tol biopolymer transport system component
MNADGTHQRTLTRNGYRYESAAAWSPDGREILYNGENNELVPYQNPPRDIVIIGKEGGTPRIITPFDFRAAVSIATSWRKE